MQAVRTYMYWFVVEELPSYISNHLSVFKGHVFLSFNRMEEVDSPFEIPSFRMPKIGPETSDLPGIEGCLVSIREGDIQMSPGGNLPTQYCYVSVFSRNGNWHEEIIGMINSGWQLNQANEDLWEKHIGSSKYRYKCAGVKNPGVML